MQSNLWPAFQCCTWHSFPQYHAPKHRMHRFNGEDPASFVQFVQWLLPRSLPLIWTWSPNHLFPLSDLPSALCVPRIEILGCDYAQEYPRSFQTDPSQDDTILPISWMRILGCRGRFFHLRNTFPNNAFQGSKIRSGHIRLSWKNAPTHRKLWNCHDLLLVWHNEESVLVRCSA